LTAELNLQDMATAAMTIGEEWPLAGGDPADDLDDDEQYRSTAGSHCLRWLEDINLLRVMVKA
jgi:hypothetical protein